MVNTHRKNVSNRVQHLN